MKSIICLAGILIFVFCLNVTGFTQDTREVLILDDFEGEIITGPNATIDSGTGNGSYLEVLADKKIKKSGEQSLKIIYKAVAGGYMWAARGYGLDVKGAAQWLLKPQEIGWKRYTAVSFYMYGSESGTNIAFDIKDAYGEMFRFMVKDDFKGWKLVVCRFDEFFPRGDWQSPTAEVNGKLDFPLKSFQFEPIAVSEGEFYVDEVRLEIS